MVSSPVVLLVGLAVAAELPTAPDGVAQPLSAPLPFVALAPCRLVQDCRGTETSTRTDERGEETLT
jgi:hypothetical protein